MRHGKKINHLSRKAAHRQAMLANMACSLIEHKRIHTTVAKAKALKIYFEPLVTKSKSDSTHSRRIVFSYLQSKDAVTELFRDIAPKIGDRPGGYTRIIKTGPRQGDAAEMCFIELVDFNELMLQDAAGKKKTTRRSRRGKKTTGSSQPDVAVAETKTTEAPAADVANEEAVAQSQVEETPAAEAPASEAPEENPDENMDDQQQEGEEKKEH